MEKEVTQTRKERKKECTALMNLHQVLLKAHEQKTIKSGFPVLPQLLACNRGISRRRLEHTHTHSRRDEDVRFVFSH